MKGIIVEKDGTIHLADDIPMPEPGPYEALVKIESCMICNGTDMEIIRGELPEAQIFPTVLRHESAGRVVKIGEKVKPIKLATWLSAQACRQQQICELLGRIF